MSAKYAVGIDLGTTNSVLAYVSLQEDDPGVQVLKVAQLVAPGTVEARKSLPSFLYLPSPAEDRSGYVLSSISEGDFVVGALARQLSATAAKRTVAAAKSWLTHTRVDRHQAILPWNAPADSVTKVSPVEASRRYLSHLAAGWNQTFPEDPLDQQQVVLTVPASFDASARTLTREAAAGAGLPQEFVLLEEPQAAVYAWLAATQDQWRKQLSLGDVLLVCDIGGGTTDLTLIVVSQQDGDLVLERRAVGNHVLVGGDNMDLALAHYAAGLFQEKGVKLDPWQSVSLWHACRAAKETLLGPDAPGSAPVTVLGRGSKLIGGSVTVDLAAEVVRQVLLDGFLPPCKLSDRPVRQRMSGFQELGLPYESEPAVTKHLAAFLNAHASGQRQGGAAAPTDQPVRPTHVLFNGGVFKSEQLRGRLLEVLASWYSEGTPPQPLSGQGGFEADLDYAVAQGAAYYAWTKQAGRGVRIRGGTGRSYYVGVETAGPAIPGATRPLRALCVVPFGMEEGTQSDVPMDSVGGEIGLVVGETAHFRFFSSAVRQDDAPGLLLSDWDPEQLEETDSLEATLDPGEQAEDYVPVQFQSRVTELGVLELWSVATNSDQRWKLEFSVRDDAENAAQND